VIRVWVLLSLVIFLPACIGTQQASTRNKKSSAYKRAHRAPIHSIEEQEAKLVDIPLPIDISPISQYFSDNTSLQNSHGMMLGYTSNLTSNAVATFYMHEMERLGWQQLVNVDTVEQLLIFSKPHKMCAISIRSVRKGVALIILVAPTHI